MADEEEEEEEVEEEDQGERKGDTGSDGIGPVLLWKKRDLEQVIGLDNKSFFKDSSRSEIMKKLDSLIMKALNPKKGDDANDFEDICRLILLLLKTAYFHM